MAKIYISFLVIALLASSSCKEQEDFPLDIWISTSCNEFDMISVRRAVNEINSLGLELLNENLIVIAGRVNNEEVQLNIDGLTDGISTLTCYHEQNEDFKNYIEHSGSSPGGVMGTGFYEMDVFIYNFNIKYQGQELEDSDGGYQCKLLDDWPEDLELPDGASCPIGLTHVMTHELGHFIGLGHVQDDTAMMSAVDMINPLVFNKTDKIQFCCRYECITNEYECTLDEVPIISGSD